MLRDVLAAIGAALADPPYNVVVHTAPTTGDAPYHWWIEVVPRVSVVAGFEVGTGVMVNTTAPESAAATLRDLAS
jgi:UDPglucose--hexose-1-phosphate uridylyltransferase